MEWSSNQYAQFMVPAGSNIFGSVQNQNIKVTQVSTSATNIQMGTDAHFCHACVKDEFRYGDTCWGLISQKSTHRDCGCNSGGWAGFGIYYGGYKDSQRCSGFGGGFSGAKETGKQKGGIASLGLKIMVRKQSTASTGTY